MKVWAILANGSLSFLGATDRLLLISSIAVFLNRTKRNRTKKTAPNKIETTLIAGRFSWLIGKFPKNNADQSNKIIVKPSKSLSKMMVAKEELLLMPSFLPFRWARINSPARAGKMLLAIKPIIRVGKRLLKEHFLMGESRTTQRKPRMM